MDESAIRNDQQVPLNAVACNVMESAAVIPHKTFANLMIKQESLWSIINNTFANLMIKQESLWSIISKPGP